MIWLEKVRDHYLPPGLEFLDETQAEKQDLCMNLISMMDTVGLTGILTGNYVTGGITLAVAEVSRIINHSTIKIMVESENRNYQDTIDDDVK